MTPHPYLRDNKKDAPYNAKGPPPMLSTRTKIPHCARALITHLKTKLSGETPRLWDKSVSAVPAHVSVVQPKAVA